MAATKDDFQRMLEELILAAQRAERAYVEVVSGELHQKVGGYPGPEHRMPLCCWVMKKNMKQGDAIIKQPPSGQGKTLIIRYSLPR